jgi:hypothetical protein
MCENECEDGCYCNAIGIFLGAISVLIILGAIATVVWGGKV